MSKRRVSLFGRGLLVAAAVFGSAQAQEAGFTRDLKVRLGYAPSTKDNLSNSMLGFGLNFGFSTGIGQVGVEVGYAQKGGDQFQKPVTGVLPAGLSPIDIGDEHAAAKVGDSRRNTLDGFSVRLSLSRELSEAWRWQAGLMLGGTRFKHEYVGDVSSAEWNGGNANSWRDFYFGTPTEGGLSVSPYVGASYKVSNRSSLEFNLVLLSYKSLDYTHRPGTGSYAFTTDHPDVDTPGRFGTPNLFLQDTLEKKSRVMPHLEISYVFHF